MSISIKEKGIKDLFLYIFCCLFFIRAEILNNVTFLSSLKLELNNSSQSPLASKKSCLLWLKRFSSIQNVY